MLPRRSYLKLPIGLMANKLMAGQTLVPSTVLPEESEPHLRTWMAFVARDGIWSSRQIPEVKRDLARIAASIAQYEPVSMLVASADVSDAKFVLAEFPKPKHAIKLIEFAVDDLWLRDTGPIFVRDQNDNKFAIDFNFNGWGNKQQHSRDKKVAEFVSAQAQTQRIVSTLVLEGGCFEVDGRGTAIMSKSCIINDNRNQGVDQHSIEAELKRLLGLRKIIWLEGIKGKDITDGHTDFYARFTRPGQVIVSRDNYRESYDYDVTRENIRTLEASSDADGKPLQLLIVDTPELINERFGTSDFAAGYVGYYVCNGAVIAQKFGDKNADRNARKLLQQAFPDRRIEQIAIDAIASGGGTIHCATQQEILV